MGLMDDTEQVRALFYVGHATKNQMDNFYTNVQLDDVILLSGFLVEKSDRGSSSINSRIELE